MPTPTRTSAAPTRTAPPSASPISAVQSMRRKTPKRAAWLQDKRTIIIDIHKQPGFNVVETIRRIKERLPALTALLPPSVKIHTLGDRTQTIEASVHDVQVTLRSR